MHICCCQGKTFAYIMAVHKQRILFKRVYIIENYHVIEDRVYTSDNWCPTREDKTVSISLIINNKADGYFYRVVAAGEDDLMLYRDFYKKSDLISAHNLFNCLLSHNDLTINNCRGLSLKS